MEIRGLKFFSYHKEESICLQKKVRKALIRTQRKGSDSQSHVYIIRLLPPSFSARQVTEITVTHTEILTSLTYSQLIFVHLSRTHISSQAPQSISYSQLILVVHLSRTHFSSYVPQ